MSTPQQAGGPLRVRGACTARPSLVVILCNRRTVAGESVNSFVRVTVRLFALSAHKRLQTKMGLGNMQENIVLDCFDTVKLQIVLGPRWRNCLIPTAPPMFEYSVCKGAASTTCQSG